jgi:hypothetical protein
MDMEKWVPTIICLLGGLISFVAALTITRARVDNLDKREKKIEEHLETSAKELQTAIKVITVFTSEQSVINKFQADALSAILHRVEAQDLRLRETEKAIAILTELLKQSKLRER